MNPIYASDEQQLDFIGIGMEILRVARNELYLNMRFLDVALSSLQFVPDGQIRPVGTDGVHLYFQPDALADLFLDSSAEDDLGRCLNGKIQHIALPALRYTK